MITKLLKYSEIPNDALAQIQEMYPYAHHWSPFPFKGQFTLQFAIAKDATGKVICCVTIEKHGSVYFASSYIVNPTVTPEEAVQAGNEIDAMLAHQGQIDGVKGLLMPIPEAARGSLAGDFYFHGTPCFTRPIPQSFFHGDSHLPIAAPKLVN